VPLIAPDPGDATVYRSSLTFCPKRRWLEIVIKCADKLSWC